MKIRIGSRTSKLALKQVEIAMKRIGVPSFEIMGVDTCLLYTSDAADE